LLATFTVAPALSVLLFPPRVREKETFVIHNLRRWYEPVLEFVITNRIITFGSALLIGVLALLAVRSLGLEFLPKLEEGNLWVRATFPTSISLQEANSYVNQMRATMGAYPEVQTIVSQHGRPASSTRSSSCRSNPSIPGRTASTRRSSPRT
jgi:heavy metal efflux system protein